MTIQCCGFLERTDRTSNSCGKTACFGCLDAFCPLVFFKWRCRTTTHAGRRFAVRCKRCCGLVPTENRADALRPRVAKKRQKNRQTATVLSAMRASPPVASGSRQSATGGWASQAAQGVGNAAHTCAARAARQQPFPARYRSPPRFAPAHAW